MEEVNLWAAGFSVVPDKTLAVTTVEGELRAGLKFRSLAFGDLHCLLLFFPPQPLRPVRLICILIRGT